jgi:hypothetical protein
MTAQRNALELADALDEAYDPDHLFTPAAEELRRLHAEVERLRQTKRSGLREGEMEVFLRRQHKGMSYECRYLMSEYLVATLRGSDHLLKDVVSSLNDRMNRDLDPYTSVPHGFDPRTGRPFFDPRTWT